MQSRPSRSSAYQWKLIEVSIPDDLLNAKVDLSALPISLELKDQLLCLDDQLKIIIYQLLKEQLTEHQFKYLFLLTEGYTQVAIAKMHGILQTSVNKSIFGNKDTKNNKQYGGIGKKMILLLKENKAFQLQIKPILFQIYQLNYLPSQIYLPHYQALRNLLGTNEQFEQWILNSIDPPTLTVTHQATPTKRPWKTILTKKQKQEIITKYQNGALKYLLMKEYHISLEKLDKILEKK